MGKRQPGMKRNEPCLDPEPGEKKQHKHQAVAGILGKGKPAEVLIYDNRLSKIKKRFYPYDKTFKGGIYVSAGDLNGDKKDEIVVSPVASKTLPIRVFDAAGKKLAEFKTGALFGTSGSMVGTVDINYDGKMEVAITSL